jgi:hypothetical protein
MELVAEWADLDTPPGRAATYLARAARGDGPRPDVVVIQEIWGVQNFLEPLLAAASRPASLCVMAETCGRPPGLLETGVLRSGCREVTSFTAWYFAMSI